MKGAIMLSGGGTKLFAALGVTYPAGSTVTCTNGSKTLTAKTTSGQWVFAIPEVGTWTVTSTDGTNTKSQSVSITSEGQLETVTLSYRLYLIKNGVVNTDLTGGFTEKSDGGSIVLQTDKFTWNGVINGDNQSCSLHTKKTIDITDFKALSMSYTCSVATQEARLGIDKQTPNAFGASSDDLEAYVKFVESTAKKDSSVDISTFTGTYYIVFAIWGTTGVGYDIWLE
jgi:hypothetical protein